MVLPPPNIGCGVSPMTCALDPASYQWKAKYSTPPVADMWSIEALFNNNVESFDVNSSCPTLFNSLVHENYTLRERVRQLESRFDGSNDVITELKLECQRLHRANTEMRDRCHKWRSASATDDTAKCLINEQFAQLHRKDEEIARLKKKAREIVEQCQKWRNIAQTQNRLEKSK